jgi:hypothetical protein
MMARPWKMGSNRVEEDHARAHDDGGRGEHHRPEAHGARVHHGLFEGHALRRRSSMKSTRMMELRTTMPAPAMKPIMDVAVKNAPAAQWPAGCPPARRGWRT